ncbi:MAG: hypothetical protein EZS28_036802 [Streblomastix strix]|uniref:DDE-1 domain-containing protein n=1 Tax=Streblomastix strix TaxID=222440 RepID=A0A5J4UCN4_9EUKA|nr:MAG: hypothetical protein EZS28_036802 [Streblomastix strix]
MRSITSKDDKTVEAMFEFQHHPTSVSMALGMTTTEVQSASRCYCREPDRSQGEGFRQPSLLSLNGDKRVAEEIKLLISINQSPGMEQVADLIEQRRRSEVMSTIEIAIILELLGQVEQQDVPVELPSPQYVSALLHKYQLNAGKSTALAHARSLAAVRSNFKNWLVKLFTVKLILGLKTKQFHNGDEISLEIDISCIVAKNIGSSRAPSEQLEVNPGHISLMLTISPECPSPKPFIIVSGLNDFITMRHYSKMRNDCDKKQRKEHYYSETQKLVFLFDGHVTLGNKQSLANFADENANVVIFPSMLMHVMQLVNRVVARNFRGKYCKTLRRLVLALRNGNESRALTATKMCRLIVRAAIDAVSTQLPGVKNEVADALSRLTRSGDYELKEKIFRQTCLQMNFNPTIDLFSQHFNNLLPRFMSTIIGRGKIAIDALNQTWKMELPWIHPPIPLLPAVLKKIREEQIEAMIIAPLQPGQIWYTELVNENARSHMLGWSNEIVEPATSLIKKNLKLSPEEICCFLMDRKPEKEEYSQERFQEYQTYPEEQET